MIFLSRMSFDEPDSAARSSALDDLRAAWDEGIIGDLPGLRHHSSHDRAAGARRDLIEPGSDVPDRPSQLDADRILAMLQPGDVLASEAQLRPWIERPLEREPEFGQRLTELLAH